MRIHIPKLRSEQYFLIFLCLFWGQDILFSYVRAILIRIPIIRYLGEYMLPTIMVICFLLSFSYVLKRITWKDILFVMIVTFLFGLHIIVFHQNSEILISMAGTFFINVLPLYFLGLSIDISKCIKPLYIMSVINIWSFVIYNLISAEDMMASQATHTSFMHRAYVLLPQILVVIAYLIRNVNILNILTVGIGSIFLMMCGNRGSVVILIIYVIFYMLFILEKKKRISFYIIIVSICMLIIIFFEKIVDFMIVGFLRLGMSTRIIDRFLEGDFFESNGRSVITSKLMDAIWERPFWGQGLASDRAITGTYAHNYAVELWVAFGVIAGTVLLLITLYLILMAWNKSKEYKTKAFLLMMVCIGFIKLFISSSFLQEGHFFMLLGVCVMLLRQNKMSR